MTPLREAFASSGGRGTRHCAAPSHPHLASCIRACVKGSHDRHTCFSYLDLASGCNQVAMSEARWLLAPIGRRSKQNETENHTRAIYGRPTYKLHFNSGGPSSADLREPIRTADHSTSLSAVGRPKPFRNIVLSDRTIFRTRFEPLLDESGRNARSSALGHTPR